MSGPELDLLDFIPCEDGGRLGAPKPPPDLAATCPHCRRTEPNDVLLQNNHYPESWRTLETGWCIAMDLTRNHILYWQGVLEGRNKQPDPPRGQPKLDVAQQLQRVIERAEDVWKHRLAELHASIPDVFGETAVSPAHERVDPDAQSAQRLADNARRDPSVSPSVGAASRLLVGR